MSSEEESMSEDDRTELETEEADQSSDEEETATAESDRGGNTDNDEEGSMDHSQHGEMEEGKCPECKKEVFLMERVIFKSNWWHRGCLRCSECGRIPEMGHINDHHSRCYCDRCYDRIYNPVTSCFNGRKIS